MHYLKSTLAGSALIALVVACSQQPIESDGSATPRALVHYPAHTDADGYFDTDFSATYRDHLRTLASDEFEGRSPGTRGEELTVDYVRGVFQQAGLTSLTDQSYTQMVPMARIAPTRVTDMQLSADGSQSEFSYRQQMMGWIKYWYDFRRSTRSRPGHGLYADRSRAFDVDDR